MCEAIAPQDPDDESGAIDCAKTKSCAVDFSWIRRGWASIKAFAAIGIGACSHKRCVGIPT